MTVIERLLDPGIIAIVRAQGSTPLTEVAQALLAGGVNAIEATLTTPGALDSVRQLPAAIRERMAVGVGTVLTASQAKEAVAAGARFIVTPVVRLDVIAACKEMAVPVACGAFSPTEALTAHEAGADFIKIFPADTLGPGFIKSLLAPFPMLKIIPTGGITPETCGAYFRAGCVGVGAGSRLVSDDILEKRDWAKLAERAREFVTACRVA